MARATETSRRSAAVGVRCLLILLAGWLAAGPRRANAQPVPSKEYQIKAACLLNFARFIEWPQAGFPDATAPIILGVLGEDPFGDVLEQTFQDESVQGRAVVIKRSRQVEELKSAHMLFIGESERDRVPDILASLGTASIVTVGETEGFARRGGIINFYAENGRIRFEINADAARRNGLRINSQLLKRAKVVTSEARKGGE